MKHLIGWFCRIVWGVWASTSVVYFLTRDVPAWVWLPQLFAVGWLYNCAEKCDECRDKQWGPK